MNTFSFDAGRARFVFKTTVHVQRSRTLPIFYILSAIFFCQSLAAEDWSRALQPWSWQFPRDHGAHPEFKTEWWYFTGNLQDASGNPYGYQLTFFRHGLQ